MRFIPNQNAFMGFAATLTGSLAAPKLVDVTGSVDLTDACMGLTASTTGQSVPTPSFKSLFETNIPGTVTASFSADFYRYDVDSEDVGWNTLPRGTSGTAQVRRSGQRPTTIGKVIEQWPITVLSRSVPAMTSNTAVMTTVTASVPIEPNEDATIVT